MSMKISSDTIGDRSRDLPACSAMPQPTGLGIILNYGLVHFYLECSGFRPNGRYGLNTV